MLYQIDDLRRDGFLAFTGSGRLEIKAVFCDLTIFWSNYENPSFQLSEFSPDFRSLVHYLVYQSD